MEGIEKITARIIEDAEREIAQMQQENEKRINALTAEAQSAAEQESLELPRTPCGGGTAGASVLFGGGRVPQDGAGSKAGIIE